MVVGSHLHQGEDLVSILDLDLATICFEGGQQFFVLSLVINKLLFFTGIVPCFLNRSFFRSRFSFTAWLGPGVYTSSVTWNLSLITWSGFFSRNLLNRRGAQLGKFLVGQLKQLRLLSDLFISATEELFIGIVYVFNHIGRHDRLGLRIPYASASSSRMRL